MASSIFAVPGDALELLFEPSLQGFHLWLVELISPFATSENKLSEAMLLDLMQGPFKATAFNLHRTDPETGRRDKVQVASHLHAPGAKPN